MLSRDLSGFCVERRDDADIRTTPEVRGIGASQPPNFASDLVDAHPPTRRPIARPSSRSFEPLEPTGRRPVIGPYRAVAQIHSDGPLEIFLCHKQSQLGFVRRAIVKRVLRANGENYFDGRRHLFDEARALGLLEHPGVAALIDFDEDEQATYLAREAVDGSDLAGISGKLRGRGEALPFELATFMISEILRALHFAHAAETTDGRPVSILHLNLCGSNILIDRSGHVKLIGFGRRPLRESELELELSPLVIPELGYVAPEVLGARAPDPRADIYAAGVLLFELLTGRPCFKGRTIADLTHKISRNELRLERLDEEGVPPDLRWIVERACHITPSERFGSANEMANALETWMMHANLHAGPWILAAFCLQHELIPPPERWQSEPSNPPAPAHSTPTMPPPENSGDVPRMRTPPPPPPPPPPPSVAPPPISLPSIPSPASLPPAPLRAPHSKPAPRFPNDDLPTDMPLAQLGDAGPTPPPTPVPAIGRPNQGLPPRPSDPTRPSAPVLAPVSIPISISISAPPPPPSATPKTPPPAKPATSRPSGLGRGMRASAPPPPPGRVTAPTEGRPTEPPLPKQSLRPMPPPIDASTGEELLTSEARTTPGIQSPLRNKPEVRNAPPRPATEPEIPVQTDPMAAPASGQSTSGDLGSNRPADVLSRLAVERATGVVEFRAASVWKKLSLIEGRPIGLVSNIGLESVGEQLVRSKLLPRFELDKALRESPRGEDGLVDRLLATKTLTAAQVAPELSKNISEGVVDLFGWRIGSFEFTPLSVRTPSVMASVDLLQLAQRDGQRARPSGPPDPRKR